VKGKKIAPRKMLKGEVRRFHSKTLGAIPSE